MARHRKGGNVVHAGVIAVVYAARASVSVLCHTQYSHALGAAIRLFVYKDMMSLRAMYHQYQVGILLYGTARAQMAKIGRRGLVFRLTVELSSAITCGEVEYIPDFPYS